MRTFLTGASGYIGLAVLDGLVRQGHEVTGLVRNSEKADLVSARGGRPLVGNLRTPSSYRQAAEEHDAIVHAGMESSAHASEVEQIAVETLVAAARAAGAEGRPKVLLYTSGVWVLGHTPRPAAEDAPIDPTPHAAFRPAHERSVLEAAGEGLRTIVVRPGLVYGGTRGIVGELFKDASNGIVRVIGAGTNRWPLVYDRDLADLYARLLASADASGIYHANDEGDERVNDIVEAIVAHVPGQPSVRHVPIEEATSKLGTYAVALALDQVVRSPRARSLGWTPTLRSVSGNVARLHEEWRAQ